MKWKLKAVFGAWVLLLAGSCQKSAPFYQNTVVPFSFEENRGQADPAVHFFAQTDRYAVFLAEREVVIAPRHSPGQAFRMRFIDGQPARISALEPTGQTSNYLIGNDPRLWKKGVQHFARVRYENVYPDTDLVFYSESGQFRYDFVLKPGANPDNIRFAVEDAAQLGLSHAGDLVIQGDSGEFRFGPPVVYQMAENRRERVEGFYRLMAGNVVAFDVARYDGTRSLVIDPTLTYSTLLGGTGGETPVAIAVDSAGNAYIVGRTDSVDFPTASGALKPSRPDFQNTVRNYTFITKMNAQGSGILYSTYIGSDANTRTPTAPRAIAVDSEGNAYITGTATGEDLPTTPGALQPAGGSTYSGFVLKLNAAGSELVYSTFLGGRTGVGETAGNRVVVDATGNAYVAGKTQAEDFPTTPGAFQTKKAGFGGQADAFVSKLNPAGTGLVFSTFLGGANDESGDALAVDTAGNVYVAGLTRSMNFPVTPNAFQIVSGGTLTDEAFLTKLNPAGTAPVYSTYFGGNNTDQVRALFVDSQGNATLLGFTGSTDLPTTPGAYRRSKAGSGSGFLSTFNASGETLLYSTFLPSLSDAARDAQGRFYLLALPYITGFDASTSSIMYQTQLTGGIPSGGNSAIAADSAGNAFVTGFTDSVNFPVTPGSYQTSLRLGTFRRADAFVAKISAVPSPPVLQSLSPSSGIPASFISTLQLTVLGRDFEPNSVVTWDGIERKTTFVTIGELQASIPASELTSATPHDVRVTTPGLGTSDAVTFGVRDAAVPAIRSLVPSLVRAGAPAAFVRVLGSGFTGNSVVRINGEARTTTFPLQGELDVILPAADIAAVGSLRLEVFTPPPGGGLSNAVNFSVVATPDPPVVGVPVILTNPSPSEAAHGNVSFFRNDGFAQSVPVPGDSGVTTIAFAIPPLGSTTVALAPDSLSLLTGAARVTTNIPISGVVRFGSTNLGIAGVGDSRPAAAMIVPAVRDSAKGMNTGVAIHNTNSQAVEFGLTLRTMTGANIPGGYRSFSLPPNGHMSAFIHELFPTAATAAFQGTLVLNSMTPGTTLSAVALQLGGTPGQFTTMPVVPIQSATGTTELIFPHLASGDGISSSLFLLNASGGAIHGSVQSFGDSGVPIIPSGPFSINQGGGALVEASGQSTLNTGWGKVTSDGPAGGVVRFSIPGLGIAGVGAAQTGSGFIAPVSRSEASSFSTGVALISTETTTNLTLTLRDQGGLLVPGGEVQLTVPANGHVAKFIHELFPQSDTREFVGSLSVASANGPIAGVVIQLGGRPGEFTTLPVVPLR